MLGRGNLHSIWPVILSVPGAFFTLSLSRTAATAFCEKYRCLGGQYSSSGRGVDGDIIECGVKLVVGGLHRVKLPQCRRGSSDYWLTEAIVEVLELF